MLDTTLITILATVGSILITVLGAQWRLTTWLSNQFSSSRNMMDEIKKDLLQKLEYHERHDDRRFSEIRDDVWELRVRNAALDGRAIYRHRLWEDPCPSPKEKNYPKNDLIEDSLPKDL